MSTNLRFITKTCDLDPALKSLSELYERVHNPDTPADVREAIQKILETFNKKEKYFLANTMDDSPNARMIREKTLAIPWEQLQGEEKTLDGYHSGMITSPGQGPAMKTLEILATEGRKFDFVYLDADKEGYCDYFKKILDKNLLAAHGTLTVDNTFGFGRAYTETVNIVDEFNKAVTADERVDQVMLPISDGLTLIRRKGD